MRTLTETLLAVILTGGICLGASGKSAVPDATEPAPSLTPEQVIAIQLHALQNNGRLENNRGIEITFNFCVAGQPRDDGPAAAVHQHGEEPSVQRHARFRVLPDGAD